MAGWAGRGNQFSCADQSISRRLGALWRYQEGNQFATFGHFHGLPCLH